MKLINAIIRPNKVDEVNGDGRVFMLPVEAGYNIRTGERDSL